MPRVPRSGSRDGVAPPRLRDSGLRELVSLLGLLGDFFSEFPSLDGRHLRTFRRLLVPGRLTESFLEGKRASYVPPVRVSLEAGPVFFYLVGGARPRAAPGTGPGQRGAAASRPFMGPTRREVRAR